MWRYPDPKVYQHPQRGEPLEIPRHVQYYQAQAAQPRRIRQRPTAGGAPFPPHPEPSPPTGAEANAFVDAICSLTPAEAPNLDWLLDLEFGPPHSRPPAHRHIAYYDSNKRIVMSASQPNTVHPGFLRCNERFRALLVEQCARREAAGAAAAATPTAAPGYRELYRMMEEQKSIQNALMAASARHAYHRQN